MVVCKCKKATKLYCFVHKVPVCGECICAPEDQICVIRTYSEWVIDGEYDWPPKCCHCQVVLDEGTGSQTTQLGCLHLIHTSCLVSHIKSFPSHTAPAGYVCPGCSTSVLSGNRSVPSLSAKRAPISQNPNKKAMAAKPQQTALCDITNQGNGSQSSPQASGLSSKPSVPCASIRQMTCSLCGNKGHNRRTCGRRQAKNHGSSSLSQSSGSSGNVGSDSSGNVGSDSSGNVGSDSSGNVGSDSSVNQGCVSSAKVQVETKERAGILAKNVNRPVWSQSSGSSANVGSDSSVNQGCVSSVNQGCVSSAKVQVETKERAGILAKNVNRPVWRY